MYTKQRYTPEKLPDFQPVHPSPNSSSCLDPTPRCGYLTKACVDKLLDLAGSNRASRHSALNGSVTKSERKPTTFRGFPNWRNTQVVRLGLRFDCYSNIPCLHPEVLHAGILLEAIQSSLHLVRKRCTRSGRDLKMVSTLQRNLWLICCNVVRCQHVPVVGIHGL